ncbi:uncharacterized protein EV154DRAFT_523781 [Mucor mucedo]|uniref:uncharacterized protein n=1 Tax=Mucor mucedo TaxID=29922 RepID=UPI00221F8909|nr:uncharacterized protein EV154DRAFT_523781 [Mucor mucedo]KAI7880799.1 hypothetical protein EV154DRAFT_523781 [Mucor mucedo]
MGYVIEYSKNDDPVFGSCTAEKCAISGGDLCIGVVSETEGKETQWKHWTCVTPAILNTIKLAVTDPAQMNGWDTLKTDDKEKVQKAWMSDKVSNAKPDNKDDVSTAEIKVDDSANQNQADACAPVQPEIASDKNPSLIDQVQTVISNTEETTITTQDTTESTGEKDTTEKNEATTEFFNKEVEIKNDVIGKQDEVASKNNEVTNEVNENSSVVYEKKEEKDGLNESSTEVSKISLETSVVNNDISSSNDIEMTTDVSSSKKRDATTMEETTTVQEKTTVVSGRTSGKVRHIKPVRKPTRRSPRFVAGNDTKSEEITPSAAKKRKVTEDVKTI